jgi:uncharacterized OB-fold protein
MSAPKYWREMAQRYRFEAAKCKKCGKVLFPPRLACPACKSRDFENTRINDKGTIETYTIVRIPPSQFTDEAPYPVAIVNMGDNVRVLCQVADCEPGELKIGLPVRLEFRKIQQEGKSGILAYGYKCVPE